MRENEDEGGTLSLEEISNVERSEKKSPDLTKILPTFYTDLAKLIASMKSEWNAENRKDAGSAKAMTLRDDYRRLETKQKHIYEYRERKILLRAMNQLSEGKVNTANMIPGEEELFKKLVSLLAEERRKLFCEPAVETRFIERMEENRTEDYQQTPVRPELPHNDKKDVVVLEILKEVPTFAGTDGSYTFRAGDVVGLPKDVADILQKNGLAKMVDVRI